VQADGETEGGKWRVATLATDWPGGGNAGKPGQSVFSKVEPTRLIERRNMIAYIYRPRRRRNGKLIFARLYRARVRFQDEHKAKDIPLHVTEKRSAEQKLQQILNEHSQESVGLIAPKAIREAAETPLTDHSAIYARELVTAGCVKRYVQGVENYVGTLLKECKWEYFRDINAEAFQNWRQRQKKSPKTLNEYLVATRAFLK
jgi:hypothetical protein